MKHLTFERKMIRFISRALVLSTAVIILVSAISNITAVTNKSTQMATREVEVMTANTENQFRQYHRLIWAIVLDRHIQTYLQADGNLSPYMADANGVLDNVCNMWENVNFISIIREDQNDHLIKGNSIPNWMANYQQNLMEDYENSISMKQNIMQMSFSDEYNINGAYSLNIYYPLYSSSNLDQRLGTLCMNVDDTNLLQLLSDANSQSSIDTSFVHQDGKIISGTDISSIGTELNAMDFKADQKIKVKMGSLMIYKKLNGWNFYYVTQIGWWELLQDSIRNVVALTLLLGLLLLITVRLARQLVTRAYEPWGNVVKAMGKVSQGTLETRLPAMDTDPDMEVVAQGFNSMMGQLIKLMEQVKEEQYQLDEIRMEALQSQIQPHFLYNTLDCIHWQAAVSGNQDISKLVKALASYYRICLSKGKDIITLGEELEYTKNYLYIQQMRYQETLNYEIFSDPELEQAVIPKLTLQPLVENAIYHGIKQAPDRMGWIRIRVSRVGTDIQLEVEDNGIGMTADQIAKMNELIAVYDDQFGYGVRNVNRRIQLYYGTEYGLTYSKNKEEGITVRVVLPDWHEMKGRHTIL